MTSGAVAVREEEQEMASVSRGRVEHADESGATGLRGDDLTGDRGDGETGVARRAGRPAKRRGRREGTVLEIRAGYFRGQLLLAGKRHSVHGPTREEVQRQFDELRRRFRMGTLAEGRADQTTLREHLRRWLAGKRGTVEDKTWGNHERNVGLHLEPALGRLRLTQLTAEHLRALYGRLQPPEGHLSPKSVREVHLTLRQALQQAVDDGWLARNVALAVRPPRQPQRSTQRVVSVADLERFWRVAREHRLFALWRIVPYLGGRSGELRALRWEDFDERRRQLLICRHLTRSEDGGRRLHTKDPKTEAGTRLLELDDELVEVLCRHRSWQSQEREWAGPRWVDHGLIFATPWGTPLLSGNVLRDFRKLLARAGVPVHYRMHDLRHTAASHLLADGVPLPEVSQILGHASPAITARLYAHAVKRTRGSAFRQLGDYYRREAGAAGAPAPGVTEAGATGGAGETSGANDAGPGAG